MRFSLLKKGSMVFLLSFLVMSISLVSFSSVAFAGEHHHDKDKKCKPSAKAIEAVETGAGFGSFTIHLKCLTPNATFTITSNLPPGCPSAISSGHVANAIVGLGGHIDGFVVFGPSTLCIPGDYTIAVVENDPDDPGLIATVPLEIDCCGTADTD